MFKILQKQFLKVSEGHFGRSGLTFGKSLVNYVRFVAARNLNKEDAMDRGRWKKLIKIG